MYRKYTENYVIYQILCATHEISESCQPRLQTYVLIIVKQNNFSMYILLINWYKNK